MFFLYDISISLMAFGMKIASLFNEKVKKGVVGRRDSLNNVQQAFAKDDKVIWMHAASLGEYEQGLPVLERLKTQYPDYKILVSFFSPSGYENVVKKKHIADVICYLPFDKKNTIQQFVNSFQTTIFFTVKYDFWYRLLEVLHQKNVPVYVVSALFYEKQKFFTSGGRFFVEQLRKNVNIFFHQTEHSLKLAESIGLTNSLYTGDTRYDRVKQNVKNFTEVPLIQGFIQNKPVLVIGSSWEAEENLVAKFINENAYIKIILAPHDLKRVPQIKQHFGDKAVLYSSLESTQSSALDYQLLIIDNIGMLSRLYHYADVAVVGGGFHTSGLHNILEAAAYAVPVIFGNQYKKNPEADALIDAGAAKSFSEESDAVAFLLQLFRDEDQRKKMASVAGKFIADQPDAAAIIIDNIHCN
ncbi:3-deoxy-D-manno-octulosonic acid transferase [Elizabethkingia miricola]|uniref:3-deoxy-D-manno-octulosonic acid transferase n=1 Tax=Elizabethkingia miricola TaxID=172045 RepID=A0ABD4DLS2_ELIMR|nr:MULTISPECIES: glycosyltransferase N-terminal domain-containing protein [Elizabethkingia]KUY19435.1 3-deoxy-D-manno-octulosonic acid transferase [Elizabethkingia miricola]MCL1651051.1 3-deoxy-D-manno-octulosonic acid transferase [Elizabethkingia miricola]MCL1678170.1 3-deoxy-D-manno-octulosonic acid transferase [Elizabethkingia miricola]OPC71598.1 3-deoxy-D-manno-octulosonic acid transferase [Elizabethkingia miricola]OPC73344.1 3-deoxy-D-manno-octulosonic acid transferase [Elizabethkingia mi